MTEAWESTSRDLMDQAAQGLAAGQAAGALELYDRVIALDPRHADAHHFRSLALVRLDRPDEALAGFEQAVAIDPGNVGAFGNRGILLLQLRRLDEALSSFDRAIALDPGATATHINRGNVLLELHRPKDALACFDRAIALRPGQGDAHYNRGIALTALARFEEAAASYGRALALNPNLTAGLANLGEALIRLGRPLDAAACYGRLGLALETLTHLEAAAASFERARALDPGNADSCNNLGVTLTKLGRLGEAVACFEAAIALIPMHAMFHQNRADALRMLGRLEAALTSYDAALALDPDLQYGQGMRLFVATQLCQWAGFEQQLAGISRKVKVARPATTPFPLLAVSDDPRLQRQYAEAFNLGNLPQTPARPLAGKYPRHDRIRIGYFSADFQLHATMHLIAEVLEAHDRRRFEPIAFSFGPDSNDEWRRRAIGAFDRFFDVRLKANHEIAELARRAQIDIAVDLKGYTQSARPGIFAARAAPIQAAYLGYPGTMGAPFIDYLIADRVLIPEASKPYYAEKIVFLPGSYQANCRTRKISEHPMTRHEMGLPDDGFVYCCFNQAYKIMPHVFAAWMNILNRVDRSILWLWVDLEAARDNLRRQAASRGIDPSRLIFAAHLPAEDHLNRLRLADLFLDTLPCNAHTTASDALRMGLPLLTCAGESFAGRVAASLLEAVGLPELIAANLSDYEAMAVELATDAERRASVKNKLAQNIKTSSLFDGTGFIQKLESAYCEMYERYMGDLQPADIYL